MALQPTLYRSLLVSIHFQKRDDGQPTHNVIDVWERNITGAGVVIAVVDEGLDPEHPELKANYVSYTIYYIFIKTIELLKHTDYNVDEVCKRVANRGVQIHVGKM